MNRRLRVAGWHNRPGLAAVVAGLLQDVDAEGDYRIQVIQLRRIPDEIVRHTAEQAKTELGQVAARYFDAVKRTLLREEPDTFS